MSASDDPSLAVSERPSLELSGNYQPIHLEDTVGAIFLGILAVILLIGWRNSEARCHRLVAQRNSGK